jgi:GntR family transcriptional regulator/MocR family aminotransferase
MMARKRNTVLNAFEQLLAEGYIEGKIGSGTYVNRALPEDMLQIDRDTPPSPSSGRAPSGRGTLLGATPVTLWAGGGAAPRVPSGFAGVRYISIRHMGAPDGAALAAPASRSAELSKRRRI